MWEYRKGLAEKKKKKAVDSDNMDINSEDSIGLGLNDNGNDNGNEIYLDDNDDAMEIDEDIDSLMVSVTVQDEQTILYVREFNDKYRRPQLETGDSRYQLYYEFRAVHR
mmetsp:Transcript_28269/g.34436  ORF Transcript_28269/g.34436 Transcript_28269/m.34436 type:complete len:109 (+) Transcript_28269:753-1079(+)